MPLVVPYSLRHACQSDAGRREWLRGLPRTVERLLALWQCEIDSVFEGSTCAWVAKVRWPGGVGVLKVPWPHFESEHEAEALAFWKGTHAVELFEVDVETGAMLMEYCDPGDSLRSEPEREQDIAIAEILRGLWRVPAAPPFRPLSVMLARWRMETLAEAGRWPDPRLVREGLAVLQELSGSSPRALVLATDMHAGNVLRARREPWLAIDPKPFLGDPAYDLTQHLLNCRERLAANPHDTIQWFADLCEVDAARVRLWLFGRLAAAPREVWEPEALQLARRLAL